MKKLDILFPKKQHLQVDDIVDKTSASRSKVARAAMQIGLKALRESGPGMADQVAINDLKALN